jgi:hypothetical protein
MKFKISKSKIEGKGLFCTEPIKAGELLFTSKGLRTLNKSTTIEDAQITHKHSISIDEKTIHCPPITHGILASFNVCATSSSFGTRSANVATRFWLIFIPNHHKTTPGTSQ